VAQLKAFIRAKGNSPNTAFIITSSPPPSAPPSPRINPIHIKKESDLPELVTRNVPTKTEPDDTPVRFVDATPAQLRTRVIRENNQDVVEILSSDEESESGSGRGNEMPDVEHSESVLDITDWQDPAIQSNVIVNGVRTRVTRQQYVQRVETLRCIPSVWPVPRTATAYIVDLRDQKYHIIEKGKTVTVDALIKNKVCTLVDQWVQC
jgi:hypothetical protein